jgi:hypothetical protein
MKKITLLVLLCSWLACGWAFGATPDYVPLTAGTTWEYQNKLFDLPTHKQLENGKAIKKNQPAMDLQGTKVTPQVFSFYEPANVLKQENTSFIAADDTGIYVFASQGCSDKTPQVVPQRYYILKFPLTQGASWKQQVGGYILQDTVESTDASVQVPAGSFAHCLLVKKVYFSPGNPSTPIQEGQFWFAPGVGNVKAVTRHLQEKKEMTLELESFKK